MAELLGSVAGQPCLSCDDERWATPAARERVLRAACQSLLEACAVSDPTSDPKPSPIPSPSPDPSPNPSLTPPATMSKAKRRRDRRRQEPASAAEDADGPMSAACAATLLSKGLPPP